MNPAEINEAMSKLLNEEYNFYAYQLDNLQIARRKLLTTQALKVRYLNTLRDIVARKCPKNKMGSPLVSDYDLLDAEPLEICEALLKIFEKKENK